MITRFMEAMFSNTDEELANQVDKDIKDAQKKGSVDTEEVRYERIPGSNDVAITDKENGEVTVAQKATDEADTYDLVAVPDGQLERFLHPSDDGVHFGNQVGAPDEDVKNHFGPGHVISPNLPDGGLNPNAGHEKTIDELYCGEDGEQKSFGVVSDNTVVARIFNDQAYCERIFSEVIESEETAKVGDLKIEKIDDEENAVVVTNETTGDQAKVVLDDDEMTVTELDSKNFGELGDTPEGYMPLFVVGVKPFEHIIVDAQEYDEDSAEDLKRQLEEDGVEAVEIFDNQEDARDYAMKLIDGLGAAVPEDEEPELQKEYSEYVGAPVFATRLYSDNTEVMCAMFSESVNGISDLQDEVESAISEGDQVEMDDIVITPVDAQNAVIEDKENGEFTKATVSGADMKLEQIDEDEFNDITGDLSVIESESDEYQPLSDDDDDEEDDDVCPECGERECVCDDDEEDEKSYCDYCDETETRFFSEGEEFTDYMTRIYSGFSDQDAIEDALENGDQIETDTEVITPVDSKTAVVEDKDSGEFSKVVILNDDAMNIHPISDDEAENLTADVAVDEDSEVDEDEEEKDYSIYTDETETRFFSADEDFSDYMMRIYSEEADQDEVEKAIEDGEQIENDSEVITPVDSKTAVIEDKESGEFTKATLEDDEIHMDKISEDEADELTEDLAVEDNDEDEDEKDYSVYTDETETRFFSADEDFSDYMMRIYSEEADQDEVEKAIEDGEQIENDDEVITPVDAKTAVIEDKESGEFTKAVLEDDEIHMDKISEEEADELTEDLAVEDNDKDEDEEKKFSNTLDKFFADIEQVQTPGAQPVVGPVQQSQTAAPVQEEQVPQGQGQQVVEQPEEEQGQPAHSVEEVEDKALAAVQSIKAAAEEAAAAIMEAKAAPVEDAEPDIQEAQFSERTFSDCEDTLSTWLNFRR